jgi:hypothetical protein
MRIADYFGKDTEIGRWGDTVTKKVPASRYHAIPASLNNLCLTNDER